MTLKIFVLGGNGLLESAFKLSKAGGRSLRSPRICVCHVEFILAATSWKSSRIISRRFHRRKRSFSRGPTDQLRPSYRPGPSPKLRRRDPRRPGHRNNRPGYLVLTENSALSSEDHTSDIQSLLRM